MANLSRPATAARAAVNAAAMLTRELEQRMVAPAVEAVTGDGRKQRWDQHKQRRRSELIEGTITAVQELGYRAGMDEIARHIGVSKTVLYRYFADRNELADAVTDVFLAETVLPALTESLTEELDDYELVHTVIRVCVGVVADNTAVYRFCASQDSAKRGAATHRILASTIESTLAGRLADRSAETDGAGVWALAMVGSADRVLEWWISDQSLAPELLADRLTMLIWGGVAGIVMADGSPERFTADPPQIPPILRPADSGQTDPGQGVRQP